MNMNELEAQLAASQCEREASLAAVYRVDGAIAMLQYIIKAAKDAAAKVEGADGDPA